MNENEKIARECAVQVCYDSMQASIEPGGQQFFDLAEKSINDAITRATEGLQKELEASDKSLRAAITNSDELSGMNAHLRAQLAASNEQVKNIECLIEGYIDGAPDASLASKLANHIALLLSTPATKEEKR